MSDQSTALNKVNLADAFSTISEAWSPRVAGDINDMQVKIAKFEGRFDWHHHDVEDELFLVIKGKMRMGLRDDGNDPLMERNVDLDEGEMIIVPHGVQHRPESLSDECHVLMLEPATTLNTGTAHSARTVANPQRL